MKIITISREFGSGGRELGKRLADLLGFDYYDREIITSIARDTGLDEKYVANILERHGWQTIPITFRRSFSSATTLSVQSTHTELLLQQKRVIEEIAKAGLDKEISQYYAALTNMHSVGVMGDERTYDYAVALRAVTTTDFMTAESYNMPWDVLGTVTSRIVNEVKHVNRVFYDCTGKPPATIELE